MGLKVSSESLYDSEESPGQGIRNFVKVLCLQTPSLGFSIGKIQGLVLLRSQDLRTPQGPLLNPENTLSNILIRGPLNLNFYFYTSYDWKLKTYQRACCLFIQFSILKYFLYFQVLSTYKPFQLDDCSGLTSNRESNRQEEINHLGRQQARKGRGETRTMKAKNMSFDIHKGKSNMRKKHVTETV